MFLISKCIFLFCFFFFLSFIQSIVYVIIAECMINVFTTVRENWYNVERSLPLLICPAFLMINTKQPDNVSTVTNYLKTFKLLEFFFRTNSSLMTNIVSKFFFIMRTSKDSKFKKVIVKCFQIFRPKNTNRFY